MEIKEYIHLKSGRIYYVISDNVINGTNAQDGQRMVAYIGSRKDNNEFMEKFRKLL